MTPPPLQRILLADDDPYIQAIAKLALENVGGFTVQVCTSGEEAIQRAPIFAPDLILLDVMMPGRDGFETFQALRALPHTAHTLVIFMTALAEPREQARLKEMPEVDAIAKPFDPMKLTETIQKIWKKKYEQLNPSVTRTNSNAA